MNYPETITYGPVGSPKDKINVGETTLTVEELIDQLAEQFPEGFRSRDANSFLKKKYNAKAYEGRLFKELAETDRKYLHKEKQEGTYGRFFYTVNAERNLHTPTLQKNEPSSNIMNTSENDFDKLVFNYLLTQQEDGGEELSDLIKSDQNSFWMELAYIKRIDEKLFEDLGGNLRNEEDTFKLFLSYQKSDYYDHEAIEKYILGATQFVSSMQLIKKIRPEKYSEIGGAALDELIKKYDH